MKKAIQIFVCQRLAGFAKGETMVTDYDASKSQHYRGVDSLRVIHTQEIEVDVPDDNLDLAEIEALEDQIAKERGDSQRRVNLLLDRISQLKAIGHEVAA